MKNKRFLSLCLIVILAISMCSFGVYADNGIEIPEVGDKSFIDGVEYTVTEVMPVVWDNTGENIQTREVIDVTIVVSIGYIGNGKINVIVNAFSLNPNALLKYMNGTVSTWGVAGSASARSIEGGKNLLPKSEIDGYVQFSYLYLLEEGTQYTRTEGNVEDVYGNKGWFGPSVGSATIRPV